MLALEEPSGQSQIPTDDRPPAIALPPIRMPRPGRAGRRPLRRVATAVVVGVALGLAMGTLFSIAAGSAGTRAPPLRGAPAPEPPLGAPPPEARDEASDRAAARAPLRRAAFERAMSPPPPPPPRPRQKPSKPSKPRIHVPLSEVDWVR
jgi:hypothetical protein